MVEIEMYKTFQDYQNETGINQIALPLKDAITVINPFFVMLFGLLIILTTASYYTFANFIGRTRFFNSLLASSFVVTIISFFLAMAGWISVYEVLMFIGITVITYIATVFYK